MTNAPGTAGRTAEHGVACWLLAALAVGCGDLEEAKRPHDVVATVSPDIVTVVKVSWTTDEPSIGYVEYGPTKALGSHTPLEDTQTTAHQLTLLGLTSDTPYYYRVVTWDGDAGASEIGSVRTGYLPVGLPQLTVTGAGHDQFTIVPLLGRQTAVVILDPNGNIVWYHTDGRELDFYRARLSRDGKSVLYNAASVSGDPAENSELVRVSLDGSESSSIPVPLLAHDFVEHPDGTLGAMVVHYEDFEGTPLRGDSIVEIDPAGNQRTIWTSWDCFDPATEPGDDIEQGWTFGNALDFDPDENVYYQGMRNFSSIAKINRDTGECEWVFGSTASTIDFAPGSARFLHEHQFQLFGDHLLIMDNDGSLGTESRVLEYQIDWETNVATEVWSYVADPTVYTFVLGEPIRLPDKSTFIDWSTAGQMERVSESGESIWRINSPAGIAFGFVTLAGSLYTAGANQP